MKLRYLAFGLIACIGIFHAATIRDGHSWGDDFSMYILHARNLAEGLPYEQTGYIYNPDEPIAPPTYPPGLPLFLSLIYRWFGLDFAAMKIGLILLFLPALFFVFLTLRQIGDERAALAVTAIVGLNPYFWIFKDEIASDIPFLLLTYAGFFLLGRAERPDRPPVPRTLEALLAGIVLLLAYATRSVGVVLIAAVVAADLIRHRRPTRLTAFALLPLGICLMLGGNLFHQEAAYARLVRRPFDLGWALMNAEYYTKELRDLWKNGYGGIPMRVLFLAMNGLAITGFVSRLRRQVTRLEVFTIFSVAVIFVWPHYQGLRFLIPLIPLYIAYAVVGLEWWVARWRPGSMRAALQVLLAVIFTTYAARYTTLNYGPLEEGVEHPASVELFTYLNTATPPDAVCIFFKPRALALLTGRRSAKYHVGTDEAILGYFDRLGVGYVIVMEEFFQDREFLHPLVRRHMDRFEPVYRNEKFVAYRMRRVPASPVG